jgi:hypothetical protein
MSCACQGGQRDGLREAWQAFLCLCATRSGSHMAEQIALLVAIAAALFF